MPALDLTPNAIVGYRIRPDWYNFTVVVVKRHGSSSSKAGETYEESLAYCKNLEHAVHWLVEHVTRVEGERLQGQLPDLSSCLVATQALEQAITAAKQAAVEAVQDLKSSLQDAALAQPAMMRKLLGAPSAEEASASEVA